MMPMGSYWILFIAAFHFDQSRRDKFERISSTRRFLDFRLTIQIALAFG
jgi:hypothetical protein